MNILGVDTSFTTYTSIGYNFSESLQLEMLLKAPFSQEEKLFSCIDNGFSVLKKKIEDIDLIAVGIGPGSFTGLRIGLSAAKSLAFSLNKKIMGISSLDLLALSLPDVFYSPEALIVPIVDARMNKVFTALFKGRERISGDQDIAPEELLQALLKREEEKIFLIGDGLIRYGYHFQNREEKKMTLLPDFAISGLTICKEALSRSNDAKNFSNTQDLEPVYLRKSEAESQWNKKN
jgi:tRNA threonylcarbamoyladenosine biosynthesis protein TsaB